MGVSQNQGIPFGGRHNKNFSIWGLDWGSPYSWKLPSAPQAASINLKAAEIKERDGGKVIEGLTRGDARLIGGLGGLGKELKRIWK